MAINKNTMLKKPKILQPGDTVAVLSPSWAGPSRYSHVFDLGLKRLREVFGFKIKEYPTTRAKQIFNYEHPELRAKDFNAAFADNEVKGIFVSIGGDDSVRLLPYLNLKVIQANPKVLMGYSDTTALLFYLNTLGIVTFNGPAVMAGFSEPHKLVPAFEGHVKDILFSNRKTFKYKKYNRWTEQLCDWDSPRGMEKARSFVKSDGWRTLQGVNPVEGRLTGGCLEVLEFLKGTKYWPGLNYWNDKILFLETSEEAPTPDQVKRIMRNYGMQGILHKIKAIIFGRAKKYSPEQKRELRQVLKDVVGGEFGLDKMPIITDVDFGHTDPQIILPLGIKARITPKDTAIELIESIFN